jgi:hypothetical protein
MELSDPVRDRARLDRLGVVLRMKMVGQLSEMTRSATGVLKLAKCQQFGTDHSFNLEGFLRNANTASPEIRIGEIDSANGQFHWVLANTENRQDFPKTHVRRRGGNGVRKKGWSGRSEH